MSLIVNFVIIDRDLQILEEFEFLFIVTSNFKNSMYPRSFLCEDKVLSQRNNFVKSVRKQYGNPDSHAFLIFLLS